MQFYVLIRLSGCIDQCFSINGFNPFQDKSILTIVNKLLNHLKSNSHIKAIGYQTNQLELPW